MIFSHYDQVDTHMYRSIRSLLLETYCLSILSDHRELVYCVGLAINSLQDELKSEDLIAIEQMEWTDEEVNHLREVREQYGILSGRGDLTQFNMTIKEFPAGPVSGDISSRELRATKRAFREKLRRRR